MGVVEGEVFSGVSVEFGGFGWAGMGWDRLEWAGMGWVRQDRRRVGDQRESRCERALV